MMLLAAALLLAPGCRGRKKKDPDLVDAKSSKNTKGAKNTMTDEERFRRGYGGEEWMKGQNALERGNKDVAIGHFERASRLDPAEPAYPLAAGQLYLEQNNLDKAETALQDSLRALQALHPDNPADVVAYRKIQAEIYVAAGDLLQKKGFVSEAINAYQSAVEANPDMARAQFELGNLFLKRNRYAVAESRFREALKADPSMLRAQVGLVIAYHLGGENTRAWKEIQDLEKKGYGINEELRGKVLNAIKNQRHSD